MHQQSKWKTRLVTVLVILFFTVASVISTNPYHYGLSDHAIIVPFLKSSLNNTLYPYDYLLTQKPFYYTYLWSLCAFLVKVFNISIPVLFFIGYCVSVFFTFLGTYLIAKTLFGKREVAFLTLFFLLFSVENFAGSITIDNIFLTRVAALPFLIFSVYYFLKEKYLLSVFLQGIGFLIHPMTAVYFMIMQGAALLFSTKYIGIRTVFFYFLILMVSSFPILRWKFLHSPPSLYLFHVDAHWLELLRLRSSHHLFPSSWSPSLFISAALMLGVFFLSWKYKPELQHHRIIKIFVIAILAMCLAGIVFSEFFPVSIVLNLQLLRSFTFIYFLTAIYYSNFFVSELSSVKSALHKFGVALLSFGIIYSAWSWKFALLTFMVLSLLLILFQLISKRILQPRHFIICLIIMVSISAVFLSLVRRNLSIYNRQEEHWLDVQRWAKQNTDPYSQFIVPPYLTGFRVESQRTIYGDWKDGTLLNFNPEFGLEWFRRMQKLGYQKGMSVALTFYTNSELKIAFGNLCENDFISIAEEMSKQNTDHSVLLVIERGRDKLNFPQVYENEKFIVYHAR